MSGDLTPQERAALLRLRAAAHRYAAVRLDMAAAATEATGSIRRLGDAIEQAEAREIAQHPDLAELNVQLDGFYAGPPPCQP